MTPFQSQFNPLQALMNQANDPGVGGPIGPPGLPFPIPPGGLDITTLPDDFELPPGFDFASLPPGAIKGNCVYSEYWNYIDIY